MSKGRDRELWAITSYFNPAGYKRRLANYRHFRANLGVPLLAVELSFDGSFELAAGDADILIQRVGGDVMWQKERLLNLALEGLPPECDTVAWLDCDVVFPDAAWLESTARLLQDFPLVHPFSELHHMPRDWTPQSNGVAPNHIRRSPASLVRDGQPLATSSAASASPTALPGRRRATSSAAAASTTPASSAAAISQWFAPLIKATTLPYATTA